MEWLSYSLVLEIHRRYTRSSQRGQLLLTKLATFPVGIEPPGPRQGGKFNTQGKVGGVVGGIFSGFFGAIGNGLFGGLAQTVLLSICVCCVGLFIYWAFKKISKSNDAKKK